jgi:hypothetical protein
MCDRDDIVEANIRSVKLSSPDVRPRRHLSGQPNAPTCPDACCYPPLILAVPRLERGGGNQGLLVSDPRPREELSANHRPGRGVDQGRQRRRAHRHQPDRGLPPVADHLLPHGAANKQQRVKNLRESADLPCQTPSAVRTFTTGRGPSTLPGRASRSSSTRTRPTRIYLLRAGRMPTGSTRLSRPGGDRWPRSVGRGARWSRSASSASGRAPAGGPTTQHGRLSGSATR